MKVLFIRTDGSQDVFKPTHRDVQQYCSKLKITFFVVERIHKYLLVNLKFRMKD